MAKQTINVGSGEYSGDGESIRIAFTKVNSNFTEVYTQVPLATTATYAQSFNTSTLVTSAVNATTSSFATTSGYALSFNTGTIVGTAVTATYAQSFNTSTLVRAAVSATNVVNGTWTFALSTSGSILLNGTSNVVTEFKDDFNPYFRDANGTFAGTATITASYVLHGSICHWHLQVDFPGTINYGNSQYQMTLPFPAHSTITTTNGTLHQVGGGGGSGADTRYAIAGQLSSDVSTTVMKFWYRSGTSDAMWKYNTPGGVPSGNPTGPAYWAIAGDAHFDISGTYQIA